jgi:hypothetical protein
MKPRSTCARQFAALDEPHPSLALGKIIIQRTLAENNLGNNNRISVSGIDCGDKQVEHAQARGVSRRALG